jgi:hypothetical protein
MKGKIIADWNKIKFAPASNGQMVVAPSDRAKLIGALQHFMRMPDAKDSPIRRAMQHFATKGDFPAEILQILEKFHAVPDYDLGYEQIFDIRDFTGTNEAGFKILDVTSGLTFAKVPTGMKAKVFKFSGDVTEVTFDMYGGGLNWDRKLLDDRQYWTLEDNAIAFRNKAYSSRASNFYSLIETAGASNATSWQAVTPSGVTTADKDYNSIRDINTINAACLTILTALKDDGVGANANSQFILLAPVALKSRILRALALLQQSFSGSEKRLNFNVTPIFTLMLSSNSYYYVCFPKAKCKGGYRMDLTMFDQFDILAYADTMVGWMRYGGAVGDTDQISRCAIS